MKICEIRLACLIAALLAVSGCASGRLNRTDTPIALTLENALAVPTDTNITNADNTYQKYPIALNALHASVNGDAGSARSSAFTCAEEADKLPANVVEFCTKMQELSYLQDYDLASWAQLQIDRRSRGGSTVFFPAFEVHALTQDDLRRIVDSGGGMKIRTRANSSDTRAYLGNSLSGAIPQGTGVELEDIRFNEGEVLPYGFGINLTLPFTVLPSTSARMNGVQFVIENFASYRQSPGSPPIEFSLGLLKSMEVANWRFDKPWVLIAKSIRSENGRLIGHSLGMDIVAATGGLRISGDRKVIFGSFDSSACTGELRWASGDIGSSYLIARKAPGADWQLVVGSNKFALGVERLYSSNLLPPLTGLLDDQSDSGVALDVQELRYCPPAGVKKVIKEAEQIKGSFSPG